MRISEVINLLEMVKANDGDLEVRCWPYDGQNDGHLCGNIEARGGYVYIEDECYGK